MKTLLLFLVIFGEYHETYSNSTKKPQRILNRKVEVFLWLPPKRHVDTIRSQQNWAVYRYLKKHKPELDKICDFRLVDTNLLVGVKEFQYRIANGPLLPFPPPVKLKRPDGLYHHLRYLILLDSMIINTRRLNVYNNPLIVVKSIEYRLRSRPIAKKELTLNIEYKVVAPQLKISPPIRFERQPFIRLIYQDGVNSLGVTYRRNVYDELDILQKMDYKSGMLSDLINKLKKEKEQ